MERIEEKKRGWERWKDVVEAVNMTESLNEEEGMMEIDQGIKDIREQNDSLMKSCFVPQTQNTVAPYRNKTC